VLKFTFDPKKAAQAAAILLKLNGGDMDKYLFVKMLYLADRESMKKWGEPITGDCIASMQLGPVVSTIYDLTKGLRPSLRADWEPYISNADDDGHRIRLLAEPSTDELCKAEITILTETFQKFKDYTFKQIRDYTHSLPEYEDVGNSSKPIDPETILRHVCRTSEEIDEAQKRFQELKLSEVLFGSS